MSIQNIEAKVKELQELKRMKEEVEAEITSLEDEIKMTVIATGFKKDDGKIAFPEIRVPAKPVEEAPVAEAAAEPEKAETKEDEIDDTDDDFLKLLNDITKNK